MNREADPAPQPDTGTSHCHWVISPRRPERTARAGVSGYGIGPSRHRTRRHPWLTLRRESAYHPDRLAGDAGGHARSHAAERAAGRTLALYRRVTASSGEYAGAPYSYQFSSPRFFWFPSTAQRHGKTFLRRRWRPPGWLRPLQRSQPGLRKARGRPAAAAASKEICQARLGATQRTQDLTDRQWTSSAAMLTCIGGGFGVWRYREGGFVAASISARLVCRQPHFQGGENDTSASRGGRRQLCRLCRWASIVASSGARISR